MADELCDKLVKTLYLGKYIKRVFEEEGICLDDFELQEPIELKKEVFELFDKYIASKEQ